MSDQPWLDDYPERKWQVYQITPQSGEEPKFTDAMDEFCVCGSDSDMAINESRYPGHRPFFFYDIEQVVVADRDKVYGIGGFGRLQEDWRGHPPGSLVLVTYEGVHQSPIVFTYLVEAAA